MTIRFQSVTYNNPQLWEQVCDSEARLRNYQFEFHSGLVVIFAGDRLLDIPCKVCGDRSSGKHYGIYSCDGTGSPFRSYGECNCGQVYIMDGYFQGAVASSSAAFTVTGFTRARRPAT